MQTCAQHRRGSRARRAPRRGMVRDEALAGSASSVGPATPDDEVVEHVGEDRDGVQAIERAAGANLRGRSGRRARIRGRWIRARRWWTGLGTRARRAGVGHRRRRSRNAAAPCRELHRAADAVALPGDGGLVVEAGDPDLAVLAKAVEYVLRDLCRERRAGREEATSNRGTLHGREVRPGSRDSCPTAPDCDRLQDAARDVERPVTLAAEPRHRGGDGRADQAPRRLLALSGRRRLVSRAACTCRTRRPSRRRPRPSSSGP